MDRNTNYAFSEAPTISNIQRSKFFRPSTHKTTFKTGELIPIYLDEVLPGDTKSMKMAEAIRMSTPIFPVMDNAKADIYFFFVPNRLVYEHWEELNGENKTGPWTQLTEYEIPQIEAPSGGWTENTIADYMGIPTYVDNFSVSALPFRAYVSIYNAWFRDENIITPGHIYTDDTTRTGANSGDYVTKTELGALPLKVAKYHDYFTSALPEPQKGPDIMLPLGGNAPVFTGTTTHNKSVSNLKFLTNDRTKDDIYTPLINQDSKNTAYMKGDSIAIQPKDLNTNLYPSNLWANLTNVQRASINQLRQAFAIQRLYEKDALGGTRYTEIIKQHFGVESADARLQRPEYLGGKRININMDQVIQTSSTDATSPQGNVAAYSLTNDSDDMFTQSFTEHGLILGLICVRTEHTYQQGLDKVWTRKGRFDFYWPTLANIGSQPIYNKEIYLQGTNDDEDVFGYQEAWADYRYKNSRVSGAFRSNYPGGSLDSWHYADDYNALPTLSKGWIEETETNVGRTLATANEEAQFIADFYFAETDTRPMPLYSVPGLIDHN